MQRRRFFVIEDWDGEIYDSPGWDLPAQRPAPRPANERRKPRAASPRK